MLKKINLLSKQFCEPDFGEWFDDSQIVFRYLLKSHELYRRCSYHDIDDNGSYNYLCRCNQIYTTSDFTYFSRTKVLRYALHDDDNLIMKLEIEIIFFVY